MSQYFLPTLKENPAEAQIVSHRLMLRAGLIRQTSAGIYAWLPLGFRVLKNIERIVREEQDASGAQEVLMQVNAAVMGVVLNAADLASPELSYYSQYSYYSSSSQLRKD